MSPYLTRFARTAPRVAQTTRQYHQSPLLRLPYKDTQDRESLRPSSSEQTKSGRDEDVAAHSDAAFNPDRTEPESESRAAGAGPGGNPLDVSGANQELSKPQGEGNIPPHKMGSGKETRKGGASGGGSPPKRGSPGTA